MLNFFSRFFWTLNRTKKNSMMFGVFFSHMSSKIPQRLEEIQKDKKVRCHPTVVFWCRHVYFLPPGWCRKLWCGVEGQLSWTRGGCKVSWWKDSLFMGDLQDEGASIGISRCSYFTSCSERNFKFAPFLFK